MFGTVASCEMQWQVKATGRLGDTGGVNPSGRIETHHGEYNQAFIISQRTLVSTVNEEFSCIMF